MRLSNHRRQWNVWKLLEANYKSLYCMKIIIFKRPLIQINIHTHNTEPPHECAIAMDFIAIQSTWVQLERIGKKGKYIHFHLNLTQPTNIRGGLAYICSKRCVSETSHLLHLFVERCKIYGQPCTVPLPWWFYILCRVSLKWGFKNAQNWFLLPLCNAKQLLDMLKVSRFSNIFGVAVRISANLVVKSLWNCLEWLNSWREASFRIQIDFFSSKNEPKDRFCKNRAKFVGWKWRSRRKDERRANRIEFWEMWKQQELVWQWKIEQVIWCCFFFSPLWWCE